MDFKAELLQQLDEGRAEMQAMLALVSEDQQIYSPWRIKEIIAHITGWDDAILAALKYHASGSPPSLFAARGVDAYNSATVTERETLSYAQILQEWQATRELVKTALQEFPNERLSVPMIYPWGNKGTLKEFILIFADHEREHAEEIQQIIRQAV